MARSALPEPVGNSREGAAPQAGRGKRPFIPIGGPGDNAGRVAGGLSTVRADEVQACLYRMSGHNGSRKKRDPRFTRVGYKSVVVEVL